MNEAPDEDTYSVVMACKEFTMLLFKGDWESCQTYRSQIVGSMKGPGRLLVTMEVHLEDGTKESLDINPRYIRWVKVLKSCLCPKCVGGSGDFSSHNSEDTSHTASLLQRNIFAEVTPE